MRISARTQRWTALKRRGALLPSRHEKAVVLLATAVLGACASPPAPRTPDSALNALVEEYFDRQLELSPMAATSIGDSRYDDQLDETTSPGFRERLRHSSRPSSNGRAASIPRRSRRRRASPTTSSSANVSIALEGQQVSRRADAVQPDERAAHGPGRVWLGHRPAAVRHGEGLRPVPRAHARSFRAGPTAPST